MEENMQLTCERRSYSAKPNLHDHVYGQLILPISGNLIIQADKEKLGDGQQAVIFLPPTCEHSFYAKSNNQFFVLDIPQRYLPTNLAKEAKSYRLNESWQAIRALLFEEVGEEKNSSGRLLDLFRYMLHFLNQQQQPVSLQYIHRNYDKSISLQELAALEHYSVPYYTEWFQKQFAMSPIAYIRKLRLDFAKELLRDSSYSVLQIAQQVGYQQQSTLTRLFKEQLGITPAAYRIGARQQRE